MGKVRIDFIDLAKGVCIVLIVLGHTQFNNIEYQASLQGAFLLPTRGLNEDITQALGGK